MITRAVAVAALLFLAGCGGGGGGGSSGGPPPPGPTTAPTTAPTNPPVTTQSAQLTFTIPSGATTSSAKRAPRFVSPNSTSISILVVSVNGNPPTAAQVPVNPTIVPLSTAPGGNCTTAPSGETCTVPIPAPTGSVKYTFSLLDSSNHVLATATVTFTVAPGPNSFNAQLNGVVATITITLPQLTAGQSFSGPITVQAFDASGALITGNAAYQNPFTLTDSDNSGATSLTDGGTTGLVITVNGPNDVVILNYDGEDTDPFTITGNVPGGNNGNNHNGSEDEHHQPVTFTGTTSDTISPSDPNYHQPTLFFVLPNQTEQFTAAQVGWSDHDHHGFTVPATCSVGGNVIANIAAVPGTDNRSFNVTSTNKFGICPLTVTGHHSTGTVWLSNTGANFILQ